MLNIKKPVVTSGQSSRFRSPAFGAGVRRVHADIDDLGNLHAPLADNPETLTIPRRIRDDIYRDRDSEGASKLERFEILGKGNSLPEALKTFLVDSLNAQEHIFEPQLPPELENLFVSQQNITPGLKIIFFADALVRDEFPDPHAVVDLEKGNIVEQEHSRFANASDLFDGNLRGFGSIASSVESPSAAKNTIPRATAAEFDRGTRVQNPDKIASPISNQISCGHEVVQAIHKQRPWPLSIQGLHARREVE